MSLLMRGLSGKNLIIQNIIIQMVSEQKEFIIDRRGVLKMQLLMQWV